MNFIYFYYSLVLSGTVHTLCGVKQTRCITCITCKNTYIAVHHCTVHLLQSGGFCVLFRFTDDGSHMIVMMMSNKVIIYAELISQLCTSVLQDVSNISSFLLF